MTDTYTGYDLQIHHICPDCGYVVYDDANHCDECGMELSDPIYVSDKNVHIDDAPW